MILELSPESLRGRLSIVVGCQAPTKPEHKREAFSGPGINTPRRLPAPSRSRGSRVRRRPGHGDAHTARRRSRRCKAFPSSSAARTAGPGREHGRVQTPDPSRWGIGGLASSSLCIARGQDNRTAPGSRTEGRWCTLSALPMISTWVSLRPEPRPRHGGGREGRVSPRSPPGNQASGRASRESTSKYALTGVVRQQGVGALGTARWNTAGPALGPAEGRPSRVAWRRSRPATHPALATE